MLDATAELPALDPAAYEAEVASRQVADSSACGATPAEREVAAAEESDDHGADAAPRVFDADFMVEVERWIAQKSDELRAQQAALRDARRGLTAGVASADALSRELGANNADLEALNKRARILEDELTGERQAAQRRAAELDGAQREATRLGQELTAARADEARHNAALAGAEAFLQQRTEALEALQNTHAALVADQQRAASELSELETRLHDSEVRERNAQRTIEARTHAHAELEHRTHDEIRLRERLTADRELLQAQLASCLERLQNREAHRTLFESTIRELDDELAVARLRAEDQGARASQLAAELEVRERQLQDVVRERDEARDSHDTLVAQQAVHQAASEQTRSALESRLAELTAEHAGRLRQMEVEIASLEGELANARREIACGRASLSDLTGVLERSQAMLAEQRRQLGERESVARTMAASHAELVTLIAASRGQIEELTGRLATPAEGRRALEERVAALTKEAAESASRLVRLESMNVELRATSKQLYASLARRDAELQRAMRIASTNAYALERAQASINELSRGLIASEGAPAETQTSILTRIDGGKNHSFVLRAPTTIGRDPDNDLSLTMGSVSRHHAVLIPASRSALLQDLGSTNGVLVNKRRVRCTRLEHGDVITLGEAQFRYTVAPVPTGAVSESQTPSRRLARAALHRSR